MSDLTNTSKYLSLILRHKPEAIGITGQKFEASIDRMGLIPKSRLYVHLSADRETAVKVGGRHGTPVVYRVDTGRMAEDGYIFYHSVNGVWLTKEVPAKYLEKNH